MHSRFLTNSALIILGAFIVVVSMSWNAFTFQWLMLGGGIVAFLLATAVALPRRGLIQRCLDGTLAVLGAWTIIASQAFSGGAVTWIGFGCGIAMVALALAGLIAHEARTERVVHSLEVRTHANTDRELSTGSERFAATATN